jgi:hypothetical protein
MSDNIRQLHLAAERLAQERRRQNSILGGGGGGGPHDPSIDGRVARLEVNMIDVRTILARLESMIIRIDAQLPHLATKANTLEVKAELATAIERLRGDVTIALAGKPGRLDMWVMAIAFLTLVVGAMGTTAIWLPLTMKLMHVQG